MTILLAFASILATAVPGGQTAQGTADTSAASTVLQAPATSRVTFAPESPVQGSVVLVRVEPVAAGIDSATGVSATLAGEALHFERDSSGAFRALGGIPIDSRGTITLPVQVRWSSGREDSLTASLPVSVGEYAMEKLTVAPRFGTAPDSALAARMADESARARAVSERSHGTPRLWDSTFIRPREARITSGFGHGRQFNGRVQSRHMGVDFAGAVGTPIRATNRGVVALVGQFYLGGNVVYIDHGAGLVTAYLHLSRHEVTQGDTVERGQVIGRVGATGRVTGPHLHWIARYGGITVNPLSLTELPPIPPAGEAREP